MSKKLTVSELSRLLGVSVNTTWKKINKKGLLTSKEQVNNREITVVILSDEQLNDLLSDSSFNQPINNGMMNEFYEDSLSTHEVNEVSKPLQNNTDMVQVIESIMNYSRDMNNQVKEYVDRVINAEKQVKLLEDVESRKDAKFHEISARCAQLESENEVLKSKYNVIEQENASLKAQLSQFEKKKSWFSFK